MKIIFVDLWLIMRFCRIKLLTLGCKFYSLFVIDFMKWNLIYWLYLHLKKWKIEVQNFQSIKRCLNVRYMSILKRKFKSTSILLLLDKMMVESFCHKLLLDDVLVPCVARDRVLKSINAMSIPKLSDYFQFA